MSIGRSQKRRTSNSFSALFALRFMLVLVLIDSLYEVFFVGWHGVNQKAYRWGCFERPGVDSLVGEGGGIFHTRSSSFDPTVPHLPICRIAIIKRAGWNIISIWDTAGGSGRFTATWLGPSHLAAVCRLGAIPMLVSNNGEFSLDRCSWAC